MAFPIIPLAIIGASGLELHQIKKKYIAHQDSALSAG